MVWEKEYRNSKLLHFHPEPQKDTLRFVKFLKKQYAVHLEGMSILDLGSGTGRNANYFAEKGCQVVGIEISPTAVGIARQEAQKLSVHVDYRIQSFGDTLPFDTQSFDIVIDVTSSNSLNETERATYLSETHRVLKPGGFFFVKALAKDGDTNAKQLILKNPGPEKDTYIMKELGLVERVFTKEDFLHTYTPYFSVRSLEKKVSYTSMNNRQYKRHFWLAYMQKI